MQHFAKPENALKRCDELCAVGQKESALVALHDVLSSKRHRTWQPAIEEVMLRYLNLCVELRKGKAAKDGLIQYRIICQQINVASMETVLRHFMELSDKATRDALEKAEKIIGDQVNNLLDFDDLEAEETPETLMLSTIGGSVDSKKRTDRQVVTPSLKFLWESFRTVLDILRNNTKLEELYRDTAARAFAFCLKYKRVVEFRRVCEILRNHITSQTKFDTKWKDREPPTPESLQIHLETRFGQLSTAMEMQLWQEAYRTVEDVHLLLQQMIKPPKASSMALYNSHLAKIFFVADNKLFHAYAVARLHSTSKMLRNAPPEQEMRIMASRAVLSAMSILPASPVLDVNLLEYDLEHEKTKRMAHMLAFPPHASRSALLADLVSKDVILACLPSVKELHYLVEQPLVPLDLAVRAKPLLDQLREYSRGEQQEDPEKKYPLAQYDRALRTLIALRMLQQMERVYLTIQIDHVANAIKVLLDWQEIETLIVWAVKHELLTLRIDYKNNRLNQQPSKADAAATSEVRDSLTKFASALDAVAEQLHASKIERRKLEDRGRLYSSIHAGVEEEHQKILSRRLIIERRKEEQERVTMEEEKERARLKIIMQRKEEAEEKERLASEARKRDKEREEKERLEEEAAQMRKLAEQIAQQRKDMKVTKKKTGDAADKVELNVDKLAEKDRGELMSEQRQLMLDERSVFEKRLEQMGKRHDHIERARREEEREMLQLKWEEEEREHKKQYAEQAATIAEQMRASRAHDLREKERYKRMASAAESYIQRIMAKRQQDHQEVLRAWREEQDSRREQARLAREAADEAERQREADIERARRQAEEQEARRIQEEQEAARKKEEEEAERQRVLERQKAREKEMEEKARLADVERQAARLAEREQKGTSWANDDEEEEEVPPPTSARSDDKERGGDIDSARRRPMGGFPPRDRHMEDGWQNHAMDGARLPPGREPPGRGGDRWESARGPRDGPPRDGPPRDGPLLDGPPRDSQRGFGRDDREGPGGWRDGPRDGPPRRDFGRDRDGPPRRDFGRDRDGPPQRGGFGDRDRGPPRSGGGADSGSWRR
mmetsp:Transcript_36838/g.60994  ORF Transcript_36838/g.60994 Transcript_36838/m.60994 type:complete len:1068 (+) Transcript_36838:75-3278(+)